MDARHPSGALSPFWDELVACGNDLDAILQLIVRWVAETVGDIGVLTTVSDDGELLEPAAIYHPDPRVSASLHRVLLTEPFPVGSGLAGKVARERRPSVLGRVEPDQIGELLRPQARAFAVRHPIHAMLIVPMIARGELIGTLGAGRFEVDRAYDASDIVAVEALAERAALAIADVRHPTGLADADYVAIYQHSLDGVLFTIPDGRVLAANPAACAILQMTEAEIRRTGRAGILIESDPTTRAAVEERSRVGKGRAELPMRRGDGEVFTAEITSAVFSSAGGELRACVIFRDVSEQVALRTRLEQQNEMLESLTEHDWLTNLHNRRGFEHVAREALAIAERERRPLQLLYFDLDNLKYINDTVGHRAGDALLEAFAAALAKETRDTDVSARLGGDEFVLVLFAATPDDARTVSARIKVAFEHHAGPSGSFSVGVASYEPGTGMTLDDLLEHADRAMYEAKARRRESAVPE